MSDGQPRSHSMGKSIGRQTSFVGGISFSKKEGIPNSYAFGRAIDHRSEPKQITLNPRAEQDSGSVVVDLPMWGARACSRTFSIGNTGRIYKKESGSWSLAHAAADSSGNGLEYFAQDGALYYGQDKTFGRLLDACTGSSYYDDFLGSEGGEPTNTKSLNLERSSSQYASRADTASTSITSDLSIEAYLKPESLPATSEIYTLVSKWREQSNQRSYKFDITTSSSVYGDGRDGALSITTNTTEDPLDANCTGTLGQYTLTISNAHASWNPVSGDYVYIHQTRGTGSGSWQKVKVVSWSSPTLTLQDPLTFSPAHSATTTVANKAQVRILKQYTTASVSAGITYSAKAWDGLKGGILKFMANDTVTLGAGAKFQARGRQIEASQAIYGAGFRGGAGSTGTNQTGGQGESDTGYGGRANGDLLDSSTTTDGTRSTSRNGAAGGGGSSNNGGGGAGHASSGSAGNSGQGGNTTGSANGTTVQLGAAGGGGGCQDTAVTNAGVEGGGGGGIVGGWWKTPDISAGSIDVSGGDVYPPGTGAGDDEYPGGAGAGGSALIFCNTAVFGTNTIDATGGNSFVRRTTPSVYGGDASDGRVTIYYGTSYTGTLTTPNATFIQDASLAATNGYILRLLLSSNGTNSETYTQDITSYFNTSTWNRWAVTWEDTTSTANFYRNGVLLGTKTGSFTSINDNASPFAVGCDFDSAGAAQNFYDGLMDDVRVWNDVRTASELVNNNDQVLVGTEANLVAYYQFTDDVTDSQTSGLNDLTATNTPTYSTDVPFSGVTTRNDEDQGLTSGSFANGYTLPTSINEGATHRQTFVPTKDPQKSIIIDIDTVGTGNWTLTVHDSLNRVVASKTVANAELTTSFNEIVFDEVWRPILGATYHFHLTSTVADGIVDTNTSSDLETTYFTTHYQFLVEDEYHPMKQMLDFMVIGNERYLAKFEAGDAFEPHQLTFPSGYRVRCLAYWREYIAIGCWKGTNITDYDDGRIFFWDGISDTYNHSIPVPEGGVNAMFGTQDVLFIVAGYTGEILVYTGGGTAQKFNKIPNLNLGEYMEIAPGSMNMWRSNIHMGVALTTDSETIHMGAYTIGSSHSSYPPSLGFDYPTSLGDQTASTVKVGMVFPSGQDLYIGWQNGNAYGIDQVSPTHAVYDSGTCEMLISDLGSISKEKYPLILRADFKPLVSGESVRVKYKADRDDEWKVKIVAGAEVYEDTAGATEVRMRVPERMKEIQVAVDLRTTTTTSPTVLGVTIETEMEERTGRNA